MMVEKTHTTMADTNQETTSHNAAGPLSIGALGASVAKLNSWPQPPAASAFS